MLCEEAQRYQAIGDLERARTLAHEALTLDPNCPAIHSLLGCIQQQLGHDGAARLHFQAALAVAPPTARAATSAPSVRSAPNLWLPVIIVGCVLFSGLATLFAFLPATHRTQQAALLDTPSSPAAPPPAWIWQMPAPRSLPEEPTVQPVARVVTVTEPAPHPVAVAVVEDTPPPPPPPGTVLGPVARMQPAQTISEPTLEMAEEAYFRGEFDHAASLYEALLRNSDVPNPRLHQDLAWCYQQLGNSGKATQHLADAVRGYQGVLVDDPQNTAAQHGIAACQAALRALRASRDKATAMP